MDSNKSNPTDLQKDSNVSFRICLGACIISFDLSY